eukprot:TRINITY_DN11118_c0_g1_i1.p2 TRINITY_DN11118_c0_g1~~TRINITY_DN11118_c0_g1_i1.p2  ORF type:complete len:422 (+),score=102.48 TRINITY_DN11118_c0_g1_i1:74-1339(+)
MSDKYNPSQPFLSRGGIGQNELDMLSDAVYKDLRGGGGIDRPAVAHMPHSGSADNSNDLLSAMAKRLKQSEAATKELKKELISKDKQLMAAKQKEDELEVLKIQNAKLALQVVEMTQFLKEQGLSWVGSGRISPLVNEGRDSSNDSPVKRTDEQSSQANQRLSILGLAGDDTWEPEESVSKLPIDIVELQQKIAELNLVAGEKVIATDQLSGGRSVSKLKDPDVLDVVIYKDGIIVNNGVFRPYHWPLCSAFMSDVLEGYFPSEYQQKYPDGFLMNLIDKSSESGSKASEAAGYRKNTFLKNMPSQVITKSGQIVQVRDNMRVMMGGDSEMKTTVRKTVSEGGVFLQVRIVGGGKMVTQMSKTHTIGDVRKLVAEQIPHENSGRPFELLTAYPRKTFSDDSQTLLDADLVPNAALLMRFLQ